MTATSTIGEEKLYKACRMLFGADIDLSRDFLNYLQPSGIKCAYRKMALQTHPDRFALASESERARTTAKFIETIEAYELLSVYVKNRDCTNTASFKPQKDRQSGEFFHNGTLPNRRLPIGQFLYYRGAVSWDALIMAILWQKKSRPRLGDIARMWRVLTETDITFIMKNRSIGESIGQAAVRLRMAAQTSINAMLFYQRKNQMPFGEYFVKNSLIGRGHLDRLLREHAEHNNMFRVKKYKKFA